MHYVYILKSKKRGSIYIGSTNNLVKRIKEHNAGKDEYTKKFTPWTLVYFEGCLSEDDARAREHNLKYRGNAIAQLKRRIKGSLDNAQ